MPYEEPGSQESSVEWSKLQGKEAKILGVKVGKFDTIAQNNLCEFMLGILTQYKSSLLIYLRERNKLYNKKNLLSTFTVS